MGSPYVLATLVSLLVALFMYSWLVPKSSRRFTSEDTDQSKNPFLRFVSSLGDDLYAALPASFDKAGRKKQSYPRVESLLVRSGNPWNLTAQEFVSLRVISAVLGFAVSWLVWLGLHALTGIPWYVVVAGVTFFCYMIPFIKHTELAKNRDIEFRRQLPEALDLITISLSGGLTFAQAVREVIPTMKPGILKGEFINMVKIMDAGGTLREALDEFAARAPNDGILTFVRSVQSATEVNASLSEILESRAKASRQEFFALVHEKTAQLESMMWTRLAPTLLPAVLIISVAPSVVAMVEALG